MNCINISVATINQWSLDFNQNSINIIKAIKKAVDDKSKLILLPELAALLYVVIFAAAASALTFSVFLIFIQIFAVKEFCIYCLISAGINILIFITSLLLFFSIN